MEKQAAKKIMIFVTAFYIVVAILAVCILNLSGSIFAKRGEMDLPSHIQKLFGKGEDEAGDVYNDMNPDDKLEGLDALEGKENEHDVAELAGDIMEETSSEAVSETYEEPSSEEASEPESTEPEPIEPEEHYYSFKTNNTDTRLRMRAEPDEDAKIIYELKPGSSGYVVELGDDWSKVSAYGHEGYCANEFLTMTEITEEEYDELKETSDNASSGEKSSAAQTADPAADMSLAALPVNTADNAAQAGVTDPATAAALQAPPSDAGIAGTTPSGNP